jgi:type I restriction enzyme S subunit
MAEYLAWKCQLLGDIAALVGGNGFPEKFQGDSHGDIPFFKVSDMSLAGNERFLARANNYVSRELTASQGWSLVPPGGVAFAKVGAALLLNRRRITTTDSLVDNNMMAAVPGIEIHSTWLYWWLQTVDFGVFVQPGALPSVNQEHLRSLRVFLPSYSEQSRIAAVLDTVDEAIAKTEAVIAKLKQVRAGLLHDLLTRGLDEHGKLRDPIAHPEQFQDSSLGQIPRAWEVKTCQNICREIVVGIVVKPAQYYVEEGVPVLRSANVREEGIQMTDLVFISDDSNALLSKSILRTGDVVTVRTGYPGTSCVVPSHLDGANCVDLIISRPSAEIVPAFLALWINSPFGRDQILKVQGGLAQQHFNVGELKTLLIAKPARDEQVRIVERIALLDSCISLEVETGAKLSRLKSGLMSDLLTGRVRVPESVSAVENQQ